MEKLQLILYMQLLGVACAMGLLYAMFMIFFDFCMNEGNILDWYYIWLYDHVKPYSPKLAKVMGLCIICLGFWVGLLYFTILVYLLRLPPQIWVLIVPYIGVGEYLLIQYSKRNDG